MVVRRLPIVLLALLAVAGEARADWFGNAAPMSSASTITPTGANTPLSLAALASQQGVLLDTFRLSSDADDTASMTRAVAAGVPILLGPKTYTINDFNTGAVASFVLRGVPGSVIQRTAAVGGAFFNIKATVVAIDSVTFDANSGSVTANQWGVLLNQGGQTISINNSVFKNNSGSLGSCLALTSTGPGAGGSFKITGNEVTNCSANSMLLGSVSKGIVTGNYVHDTTGVGISANSYLTASATNYVADIVINGNTVVRSATTGVNVGGIAAPFTFGTPAATNVIVSNNTLQDNAAYGVSLEGDYLTASGNHVSQSATSVTVVGAIDTLARYSRVQNNTIVFANTGFAIDIGGSIGMSVTGNEVTMTQGSAFNTGGNSGSLISGNIANLSGTAIGVGNYNVEGTGTFTGTFPTLSSGTVIENNTFNMSGASTNGIAMYDNAGGGLNAKPNIIRGNKFFGITNPAQAIQWKGVGASVVIENNWFNANQWVFQDPTGSGDIVFDLVNLGGIIQGASGSVDIRAFVTRDISTYNAGNSVLWITPTAVGSGYTAATVIAVSGTGCTAQAATPQVNNGQLIGVKVTAVGSGCSGTVTASATDSGGGTGATLSVGTVPVMPNGGVIEYISNSTRVIKAGGGAVSILPSIPMQTISNTTPLKLEAIFGGTLWRVVNYASPVIAFGSLPACDATHNGASVIVTASVSGKWQARCNATNWIAPDGTTIN